MSLISQWYIIINPISGNGTGKKLWPKIQETLIQSGFNFKFAFTEYLNHSVFLTQNAINQDIKNIICVGGDGTLHNVINGLMSQTHIDSASINVGVIPVGTGNDWVKTYNIPNDYKKAIKIIKNGVTNQQDLGKINLCNQEDRPIYFNNLAGIGFDGLVVSKVGKYKSLGAISYFIASISSLFTYSNFKTTVTLNNQSYSLKSLMVLIGLCQYSGGGMQLTREPNTNDGLFDISIAEDLSKWEIIANLKNLFNGKIVNHKKVKTYKASSIRIKVSQNKQPFIEADGELIGKGSFSISIIEKAFTFYC